jgi:hypothetical protein
MYTTQFSAFRYPPASLGRMTTRFFKMCRQMSSNVNISKQMSSNVVILGGAGGGKYQIDTWGRRKYGIDKYLFKSI